jgi:hypothetical protein
MSRSRGRAAGHAVRPWTGAAPFSAFAATLSGERVSSACPSPPTWSGAPILTAVKIARAAPSGEPVADHARLQSEASGRRSVRRAERATSQDNPVFKVGNGSRRVRPVARTRWPVVPEPHPGSATPRAKSVRTCRGSCPRGERSAGGVGHCGSGSRGKCIVIHMYETSPWVIHQPLYTRDLYPVSPGYPFLPTFRGSLSSGGVRGKVSPPNVRETPFWG